MPSSWNYGQPLLKGLLLDGFDVGHGQLLVFLIQGAGHFNLLGLAAEFLVETLGDITGQLVGGGMVAFFHFDDVLALISLLEGALQALAFARQGHFFGEGSGGHGGQNRNSEDQFHRVLV